MGRPDGGSWRREVLTGPRGPVSVLVREAGAPSGGAVLVACHGYTDSAACWAPFADALGDDVAVVAADAPGHGTPDGGTPLREGRPLSVPDQADDVLAVLDALPRLVGRAAPVVLVGHSMGGAVAALVAALVAAGPVATPRLGLRLVLEDPACTAPVVDVHVDARGLPGDLARLDEAGRLAVARAEGPTWPEDELAPWVASGLGLDPRHLDHGQDWGEPLRAVLARTTCPVLLVHGDPALGAVVDPADAATCVAASPGGGRVVALPVGHGVRREARDELVALVRAQLEAAAAASR